MDTDKEEKISVGKVFSLNEFGVTLLLERVGVNMINVEIFKRNLSFAHKSW